jgi:hypothetical protein
MSRQKLLKSLSEPLLHALFIQEIRSVCPRELGQGDIQDILIVLVDCILADSSKDGVTRAYVKWRDDFQVVTTSLVEVLVGGGDTATLKPEVVKFLHSIQRAHDILKALDRYEVERDTKHKKKGCSGDIVFISDSKY